MLQQGNFLPSWVKYPFSSAAALLNLGNSHYPVNENRMDNSSQIPTLVAEFNSEDTECNEETPPRNDRHNGNINEVGAGNSGDIRFPTSTHQYNRANSRERGQSGLTGNNTVQGGTHIIPPNLNATSQGLSVDAPSQAEYTVGTGRFVEDSKDDKRQQQGRSNRPPSNLGQPNPAVNATNPQTVDRLSFDASGSPESNSGSRSFHTMENAYDRPRDTGDFTDLHEGHQLVGGTSPQHNHRERYDPKPHRPENTNLNQSEEKRRTYTTRGKKVHHQGIATLFRNFTTDFTWTLLKDLDDQLVDRDLVQLKFLCKDHVASSHLYQVHRACELFELLQNRALISERRFNMLAELMYRIRRIDLLKKLVTDTKQYQELMKSTPTSLSDYRILLHEICEDTIDDELKMMKFFVSEYFHKPKLTEMKEPQHLFTALEQKDLLGSDNLDLLIKLMEAANKQNMTKKILEFRGSHYPDNPPSLDVFNRQLEVEQRMKPRSYGRQATAQFAGGSLGPQFGSQNKDDYIRERLTDNIYDQLYLGGGAGGDLEDYDRPSMLLSVGVQESSEQVELEGELPCYKMNASPRGWERMDTKPSPIKDGAPLQDDRKEVVKQIQDTAPEWFTQAFSFIINELSAIRKEKTTVEVVKQVIKQVVKQEMKCEMNKLENKLVELEHQQKERDITIYNCKLTEERNQVVEVVKQEMKCEMNKLQNKLVELEDQLKERYMTICKLTEERNTVVEVMKQEKKCEMNKLQNKPVELEHEPKERVMTICKLTEERNEVVKVKKQEMKCEMNKIQNKLVDVEHQPKERVMTICKLKEEISSLEAYSRKDNLLIDNIAESPQEHTEANKVTGFLQNKLNVANGLEIQVLRVYRIGTPRHMLSDASTRPRTVTSHFQHFPDRDKVRKSNCDRKFELLEGYPEAVRQNRNVSLPILNAAKRNSKTENCSLKLDKLILDGNTNVAQDFSSPPEHLRRTIKRDRCYPQCDSTFLFGQDSVLSNHNPHPLMEGNTRYSSAEQFYLQQKCLFSDDGDTTGDMMRNTNSGLCVIFNNKEFYKVPADATSRELKPREGSDIDKGNLEYIFNKLDFTVEMYENVTAKKLVNVLHNYAMNKDHTQYDCFTCCILTHGKQDKLYGCDGKLVEIRELTNFFKAAFCPSLRGKPKLFFIQACQGREKQQGYMAQQNPLVRDIQTDDAGQSYEPRDSIPNEADFLLAYATLPGFVSYRSRTHGSWFVNALVENIERYAHKYDLLSIMIKVNEEVAKMTAPMSDGEFKQVPLPHPTLRKRIFFKNNR